MDRIQEIKNKIEELKKCQAEHQRLAMLDNLSQNTRKTLLNSIYGQFANKFFPMVDVDVAEGITLSGQHIIKSAAVFINRHFRDVYGAPDDRVAMGDTDSAYVIVTELVRSVLRCEGIPRWTKKNINAVSEELDRFLVKLNDVLFDVTRRDFNSPLRRIEFKRETFCSEGAFLAKKRYVLHVREKGGIFCDKFKYVGVDAKKNELPMPTKAMLKEVMEGSMRDAWDSRTFEARVRTMWESFRTKKIGDIAYQKAYGTYKETVGFLQTEKGTNSNAKAAIFYNQMLEVLDVKHRYEEILVGDKIRYVYIKPNSYGISVLGYKDIWPEEFDALFTVDRETMFHKTVMKPLERFVTVNNWDQVDFANEVLTRVEDL